MTKVNSTWCQLCCHSHGTFEIHAQMVVFYCELNLTGAEGKDCPKYEREPGIEG